MWLICVFSGLSQAMKPWKRVETTSAVDPSADLSPGKCRRTVEVVKQSGLTHQGGASTHTGTGLAQGTQVRPQRALRRPCGDRFTAEVLEGFKVERKSERKLTMMSI